MTKYFCSYCKESLGSKSRFADHFNECQPAGNARKGLEMLSRKMTDKRKRKKAIVMRVDLSGKHGGEFPEQSESEELKAMLDDLNTYYEQKIPSLVSRVMSSLRLKRLRGPNSKWWKQHYLKLLGVN
jgi:hypothetical protein